VPLKALPKCRLFKDIRRIESPLADSESDARDLDADSFGEKMVQARCFWVLAVCGLLLSAPLVVRSANPPAQTEAQKALDAEPEMKAANALLANDEADYNKSPWDPTKPSPMRQALGDYADLRNHMVLLDKLESRLQKEAIDCGFCSKKQEELSELIRQELWWEPMYKTASLRDHDPIGDRLESMKRAQQASQGIVGLRSTPEGTRWSNPKIALEEVSDIYRRHCALPLPENSTPEMRREKVTCEADAMVGDRGGSESLRELAKGHEAAWSSCFRANDWVANGSARRSYESCMAANDPLSQMCASDRKALGGRGSTACPASFVVTVVDVEPLRTYRDRWPAQAPPPRALNLVNVAVPAGTHYSVTLLEPITPIYANVPSRGYKARLNETLSSADGMPLMEAGTDVTMGVAMRSPKGVLTIFVYARDAAAGDNSNHLTILQSAPIAIVQSGVLDRRVALFPAGAVLTFVADRDIHVSVDSSRLDQASTVAQGRVKKASNGAPVTSASAKEGAAPARAAPGSASPQVSLAAPVVEAAGKDSVGRTSPGDSSTLILRQNTRVVVFFSDAVSANGVNSNALLHGKLLANLRLNGPRNAVIPAQTDVFVRADNVGPTGADLTIDHLVFSGQNVPLSTNAIHQTAKTAPSGINRPSNDSAFHIGGATISIPSTRNANSTSSQGLLINKNSELIFLVNKDAAVPNGLEQQQ
jgi:hypothetical protein